jgi:pimeloyl-ACP methyl ester carboxylesterase
MTTAAPRDAEIVLFIHATGTFPSMWQTVPGAALGGRRSITPSNLGYPPHAPVPRGQRVTVEDEVAHLLASLPAGAERLHLVGHSYGALVALRMLAPLGARVASAVLDEPVLFGTLARAPAGSIDPGALAEAQTFLEDPSFLRDPERGGGPAWLEVFVDYWNRPGSWSKMPAPVRQAVEAVGWKMFQEVLACFGETTPFDAWPLPPACTVLCGERSPRASRAMARALASSRAGVALVELAGTGHMAPLTHPAAVHGAIARHFEAL